jgi:hypothetical protein
MSTTYRREASTSTAIYAVTAPAGHRPTYLWAGEMTAGSSRSEGALAEQLGVPAAGETLTSARIKSAEDASADSAAMVGRLLELSVRLLPRMYAGDDFVFRLDGEWADDAWRLVPAGKSLRYAAIAALGLLRLPDSVQRSVLGGDTCGDLIGRLIGGLSEASSPGDVAMVCWAAADAGHGDLPLALARLAERNEHTRPRYIVDVAWGVTALVAARRLVDVEGRLHHAREELVRARGAVAYPHLATEGGPWYRGHVGSFADQVYPLQALARLHRSADDPAALAVANQLAAMICAAQGSAGQWPWHYDSRTGSVVEGFPVYSVHQHAMAPMALMDLAEAGGDVHLTEICKGLSWLANPPETEESLVLADPPVIWRKVARNDPRKVVRGIRAASTRLRPGWRFSALDRVFVPGVVDHECRPYELGWLLMAWLS